MPQWVDDDTLDRVGFVLKCSFLVWITWLVIDYLDLEDTNIADANEDGVVNIIDIVLLVNLILNP